jgi:hypothetical protein
MRGDLEGQRAEAEQQDFGGNKSDGNAAATKALKTKQKLGLDIGGKSYVLVERRMRKVKLDRRQTPMKGLGQGECEATALWPGAASRGANFST